jgi:chromosome segregation protein
MRIRRLEITGFKSFTDCSVFRFDLGITGIVGPNGCGKSNVVDAIRWVMGEQSAKSLRGRGMEDVIFNGSESRSPLSMAEVSLKLEIESHDRLGPQYAGFPEIVITRRLFRDGESEYLINKASCRLLDITELFLGTGVGIRAYSIIEQGRVGLIVSAKPEDRRAFLEEAAGVTKYKSRRKVAERKIDYTQQNLLRVTDIVQELGKQLEALARQAKKAEKYRKLKEETREIELHKAAHRRLELHAEGNLLCAKLESLGQEERQSLERIRQEEEAIGARRLELEEEAAATQQLQSQLHALEAQAQLDQQNLAHWASDSAELQKRIENAIAEVRELDRRSSELTSAVALREGDLDRLCAGWKEEERATQVAEEELRRVTDQRAALVRSSEADRDSLMEVAGRLANCESNLANLFRRRTELEALQTRNHAELEILRAEESLLDKARSETGRRIDASRQLALQLAEQRGVEESSLIGIRESFAQSEIQLIALREDLSDKRARLNSLLEIQRNHEGFDRGVRSVMQKANGGEGSGGVLGLVADILSAPPQYEKAIEAALGNRLQSVIIENRQVGMELIQYLQSTSEGRSSFLFANVQVGSDQRSSPDLSRPGVLGWAPAEVHSEERFRPLVRALLGEVVIVSDTLAACEYADHGGEDFTFVTLDGAVISRGGLTGGTLEGPAVGALHKKREIGELAEAVSEFEGQYNEVLTRHYALQKQVGQTEGALKGLAKNQHVEELSLATQEKDLHKANADLMRIRERIAALEKDQAKLGQSLVGLDEEEQTARGQIAHGQSDRQSREDCLRQMSLELESLKERAEALSEEATVKRVALAANAERRDAAARDLEQLRLQQLELTGRLERTRGSLAESEEKLRLIAERVTATHQSQAERLRALNDLQGELRSRQTSHADALAQVRQREIQLRELRVRLDELTQGLSQLSLRDRELALELEHLLSQVRERHHRELDDELHRFHLLPPLTPESESRLKELRSQLERMGEINLTAVEEHAELSKRHAFLSAQQKDLQESLERLKHAIVRIDRTSRDRFKQTFEAVNEKFQQVFPRLFGGGRAGLVLVDGGPGTEPGVDVVAQPPGKKLQNVNLLSGGEKALTAVALIFAIFLIKPTPFCILDEVDAPLDEANVGRYDELVREMSSQSQFILITHNKRTMESVDTLYGVTMEEPGVSKLVSVQIRDAEAANDNRAA